MAYVTEDDQTGRSPSLVGRVLGPLKAESGWVWAQWQAPSC